MKPRGLAVGLITGAALVTLCGSAIAGTYDPTPGDETIGKAANGKLEYRKDVGVDVAMASFFTDDVACADQSWQVTGGGGQGFGSTSSGSLDISRPTSFGDGDPVSDDAWNASIDGQPGSTVVTYAICRKAGALKYLHESFPTSMGGGVRTASLDCGGGGWHVIGGGAFIATIGSFLNSSYPYDGDDRDHKPDDGWAISLFDNSSGGGMTIDAICKRGKKIQYSKKVRKEVGAGDSAKARARCAKKLHAVAGGFHFTGDGAEARAVGSFPIDRLKEHGLAPDDGWRAVAFNTAGAAKKLVVHAICIRK